MTLRMRIKRLEAVAGRRAPAQRAPDRYDDEDWLAVFEAWGRQGCSAVEPDFVTALATYRGALQRAKAQVDPPWEVPAEFMVHQPDLRLRNWRNSVRFPEVHAAWLWLAEMACRVRDGVPPVSEAEFAELAAWFEANDTRLYHESLPSHCLELGDGRQTSSANIRHSLREGPRVLGAGEVAEDVRRLRAHYGDGPATGSAVEAATATE
jgi:hypothetical protein